MLAAEGVRVNLATGAGATPLCVASMQGHEDVVRALLATDGVDINITFAGGYTPLMAAKEKGHQAIVALLEE